MLVMSSGFTHFLLDAPKKVARLMVFTPLRLYTQVKDCWGGGDPSLALPASGTGTAMGHETPLKSSSSSLSSLLVLYVGEQILVHTTIQPVVTQEPT